MTIQTLADLNTVLPQTLEQIPYLQLLILFGSRARGEEHAESDWDFAVLYDPFLRQHYEHPGSQQFRGCRILQQQLGLADDRIDIVILNDCSEYLAHVIACDGHLLFEQQPGAFQTFRHSALKSRVELSQMETQERAELERELQAWGI